ncbi:DUF6929 family protein [Longitalea luteola]|uniref:DUF6929 family protein n=1 Tax=Longitalea luteola TaxID=2812563 RepID=UPI001A9636B0|nr:hypothetical protein [Longitalea luteola]
MLKPEIRLIKSHVLKDFPSGSSINYYDGKFYLVGDDANNLIILDNTYKQIDSIRLFNYPEKRIPKADKADFESATIISINNKPHLFIIGSASTEKRKKALLLPVQSYQAGFANLFHPFFYQDAFLKQLETKGISEINIEGATIIGDALVLSNRGNNAKPVNYLIITPADALQAPAKQNDFTVSVIPLTLPVKTKAFTGVSELCYVASKDRLLVTLSEEATDNAYDDGVISDSYIGWINNVSKKMNSSTLMLDEMINLSTVDKSFRQQKIEGLCVESVTDAALNIHLVSDNDNGESKLFNIKVTSVER